MTDPLADLRALYDAFDAPVTDIDCGQMCAPHNPRGAPFCCDVHTAIPAAYHLEWAYLQASTDLWQVYSGPADPLDAEQIPAIETPPADTPPHMLLLECQGAARCQRPFRALSCRQFPFFPYITSWGKFIGLAYDWEFEAVCWVIHNLPRVTPRFRAEFVRAYDALLAAVPEDFKAYYLKSEELRDVFTARRRRIPLLHRNGGEYLISPGSERARKKISREER